MPIGRCATTITIAPRSREPRTAPPDVVFYTGCNVLKTPHIALLCLDILDLLEVDYEVMGGVGQCCGVYQYRAGDFENNSKVAYATIDGLAAAGASTVLSWCPSCQISIGEVSLPNYQLQFGAKPFDLNPFRVNGQLQDDGKTIRLWAQEHEGWLTMDATATLR